MQDLTLKMLPNLAERKDYLYLGSPYSKYPYGVSEAADTVSRIAGELMKKRIRIFCPISHCHAIAMAAGIDPRDYEIWMFQDLAFTPPAGGLIVAKMKGWTTSKGLKVETTMFLSAGKPVWGLDPAILGIIGS